MLKRDFFSEKPCEKCVTDITEIKAENGKLYVSAIFDCFDVSVLGLAMDDNMRAELCVQTVDNAVTALTLSLREQSFIPTAEPIHKRIVPTGDEALRSETKHEQCRRQMS